MSTTAKGTSGTQRGDKPVGAAEFVPADADLTQVRAASADCRGCDLYRHATQTVFGEGPASARVLMVGEQPGDQEDLAGHPFVGPAGRLLDRALTEAGFDRDEVYLTNAVKHFKFVERGKRRIHQQPTRTEVVACSAWLATELDLVAPDLVVCLGAVAAKAVLGSSATVGELRGVMLERPDYRVTATVHPSAVLRSADRKAAYARLVDDLARIHDAARP
ncbi:UdgX family uracil-DNA binding protein [Nocardia cyriacigeorgica]|uniref:Type-4 uracil-DNA glycosylase n=1 Tax=Nocardia cyriacigeorgica TaxID=135487 RepID=A0A6P1D7M0_9NOCA|nr:UdgX family uracil-DNA binding protein [Nocardia cyriacigeorgica]NEW39774.1 UdgX family uracil-DNA binding protein [Nocardia cyriacigeorgica]NEW45501.1 UdgX family uracil-DNA binding protein [Nocardia cyriacigeorgica]NEW58669.1 UdgX family uracil-DNA binding protein [Nocardia cyriacigeorgica]